MRASTLALCTSVALTAGTIGYSFDRLQIADIDYRQVASTFGEPRIDRTSRLLANPLGLIAEASAAPMPADEQKQDLSPISSEAVESEPEPQTVAQASTSPAATPTNVDESALRYFAARGDTARLQAEISRLRALYPNWSPPANPLNAAQNSDPQLESMWQLYAQARFADLRKAVADRQTKERGWQPPADLLDRLKVAEARVQLVSDSDAKHYDSVVRIAADNPSLLTCSEVDVLWRVAEALASTDKASRARDAYLYVLNNCSDPNERLATVQKAAAILPVMMVDDLLSREKTGADGQPEFEKLRDDIARRLVGEGDGDAKLVVPASYVSRLEKLATASSSASDALLLGWYFYRRENIAAAEQWFRRAWSREDSVSASQGLALVLIGRKRPAEAEAVIYRWRDASDDAKAVYLAATANLLATIPTVEIDATVLQRMAPVVLASRDAAAAQQFGWYARAFGQPKTAAEWFQLALTWKSDDEPSAYGLAMSKFDLKDTRGVADLQRLWGARSERIRSLGDTQAVTARPVALPRDVPQQALAEAPTAAETRVVSRQPRQPMAATEAASPVRVAASQARATRGNRQCTTTQNPETLPPAAALDRGWCLMNINRPVEAAMSFDVALRSPNEKTREDAAYGQSLAYLRSGLTDKAAIASSKAPLGRERSVELQKSILADRALGAFKLGHYRETLLVLDQRSQIAPEQYDLMGLRGYSYMSIARYAEARQIFEALAQAGDKAGLRGMADLDDLLNPGN